MTEAGHELKIADLRRRYDPLALGVEGTAEVEPLEGVLGQERALAALELGLGIHQPGYNIYAAGPHGIGKTTAVEAMVGAFAREPRAQQDLCFVNNFVDPYQPRALLLPAGMGRELRTHMEELIAHVRQRVPLAFESEEYASARHQVTEQLAKRRAKLLEDLESQAVQASHTIKLTPMGIMMVPLLGDRELSDSERKALPESARKEIEEKGEALREVIRKGLRELRAADRAAEEARSTLDREVALFVIGELMEELLEHYAEQAGVVAYLGEVKQDLIDRIDEFQSREDDDDVPPEVRRRRHREYRVNVVVEQPEPDHVPVIVELNPSYPNLFGRIEKEGEHGYLITDFTMIRAGSLHRANGGILVVRAIDLLRSPFSWDAVKRALRSGTIETEEQAERLGLTSSKTLQPDPVPLDLKLILVGPVYVHSLLHAYDPDFPELFKVKADFDSRIPSSDENVQLTLRFLRTLCEKDDLRPLSATGAARFLEASARLAGDQQKLSALFGALGDLVREADLWASKEGAERITAEHVEKAVEQRIHRASIYEERLREAMAQKVLRIEVEGATVGQVNGLAVLQIGAHAFGRPSRISATVGPGKEGVVDIERKVELGGAIHSKGVMILQGFLQRTYGRERPLTLDARLAFEQSYNEIDGDSASVAELCTLLSALADVPLVQGIAVTGSVDQAGRVQAVGGVNHKVEGFFDACRVIGLTGKQGVILPASNVRHLMLRGDVLKAVEEGRFHVWSAETVDQVLARLVTVPVGAADVTGRFPAGSFHRKVDDQLAFYFDTLRAERKGPPPEVPHLEIVSGPRRAAQERTLNRGL